MRCPDCQKFVGMENGDPEVESIDAEAAEGCIAVRADVRLTRNCQDCGTTLKELTVNMEENFVLEAFDGWYKLTEEQQKNVKAALKDLTIDVQDDGADTGESGGSRYAKNMITCELHFTATVSAEEQALEFKGTLTSENAAGEFEECC